MLELRPVKIDRTNTPGLSVRLSAPNVDDLELLSVVVDLVKYGDVPHASDAYSGTVSQLLFYGDDLGDFDCRLTPPAGESKWVPAVDLLIGTPWDGKKSVYPPVSSKYLKGVWGTPVPDGFYRQHMQYASKFDEWVARLAAYGVTLHDGVNRLPRCLLPCGQAKAELKEIESSSA